MPSINSCEVFKNFFKFKVVGILWKAIDDFDAL
jgi:hypothetical protein